MSGRINSGCFKPKYAPIQVGEQFGFWFVLRKGSFKHNQQRWTVKCRCGVERDVCQQHLRGGHSTRCIKCSGKRNSEQAFKKNYGRYSNNRRVPHVKVFVEKQYQEQKGLCAICGKQLPPLNKCAWDHDHKTGEGRALLHKGCNVFLGFIERDKGILKRVNEYCEKYKI